MRQGPSRLLRELGRDDGGRARGAEALDGIEEEGGLAGRAAGTGTRGSPRTFSMASVMASREERDCAVPSGFCRTSARKYASTRLVPQAVEVGRLPRRGEVRVHRGDDLAQPGQGRLEQLAHPWVHGARVEDEHARDALRPVRGDVEREQPAEGMPPEHHRPGAQRVEQPEDVRGVVRHGVAGLGLVAEPSATQVHRDHPVARAEARADEPIKAVGVGRQPVHEHQERLAAGVIEVVQPQAVHVGERRHGLGSWRGRTGPRFDPARIDSNRT